MLMKQQKVVVVPAAATGFPNALDNLKKLEQARAMLKVAEDCRQAGNVDKAKLIYAKVRALVPGSRLDLAAEKEIEAIRVAQAEQMRQRGKVIVTQAEEQEGPKPEQPKSSCPFMLMKQKKVVVVPAAAAGFPNALDNLKKLEQAQEMLENAENCLEEGMLDQAMALFRQIHLVCPGSPADRRASEQGEALSAKIGEARVLLSDALRLVLTQNYDKACELYEKLEELLPNSIYAQIASEHRGMIQYIGAGNRPAPDEEAECKRCSTEERVAELLEDCQRALTAGDYDKAARLAKEAHDLDRDCVAANALVYKAHLLLQLREKQKQAERSKARKVGGCVPLCPHMPAIDPAVVRDIERALQIREETLAREKKKESGEVEESEPKPQSKDAEEDDPVEGSPQARARAAGDCVAGLLGIVHAGTGVEVAYAMDGFHIKYHAPAAVTGVISAVESLQEAATPRTPRVIICEEEEERDTGLRGGVAP
jgi:tetratricopeptide (TPR) repeat protein